MVRIVLIVGLLGCLQLLSPTAQVSSASSLNRQAASRIVGAWVLDFPENQRTGHVMETFSSDGIATATGPPVGVSPAWFAPDSPPITFQFYYTPALGAWAQIGDGQFTARLMTNWYDGTGGWLGSTELLQRIRLDADGDSFTGDYRLVIYDVNDEVLSYSGPLVVSGTRLTAQP